MYTGVLRSGETFSDIFPELQIISPEQYERVKIGREQRSSDYEKKCEMAWQSMSTDTDNQEGAAIRPNRIYPKRNSGKALLSGNIFCGHCGGRIFATTARSAHHPTKDGVTVRIPIYKCYNKTQHKEVCDGPTTYRAEKVDQVVDALIKGVFEKSKTMNESTFLDDQIRETKVKYAYRLKSAKAERAKAENELSKWEDLMLDSIEGNCVFTPEQIKSRMDALRTTVLAANDKIQSLEESLFDAEQLAKEIMEQHQRILSWADMYASASPAEKKIVASYLIKAVTLSRGYDLQVEFQINEAQFLQGMEMG